MRTLLLLGMLVTMCSGAHIVGYWGCNPGGHASTLPQLQQALSKGYNTIVFAFFDVEADGRIVVDPGAVSVPTKAQIGKNFTYLISLFGGQNGAAPTLTMTPDAWAQAMFNNFVTLQKQYGLDGIDIDLENAWGGTGDKVVCGLRTFFRLIHGAGYIVSLAPQTTAVIDSVPVYQTGSWNSYVPLVDTGIINYVDIVAVQLYNNAVPGNDVGNYGKVLTTGFKISGCPSCNGTTCEVKIPANKIAFGFPAGPGAAPAGCPGQAGGCPYGSRLSSLYNANPLLQSTGGVMTWSVEWDAASNWQFVAAATTIKFTR